MTRTVHRQVTKKFQANRDRQIVPMPIRATIINEFGGKLISRSFNDNTRTTNVNESLFTFTLISIEFGLVSVLTSSVRRLVCSILEINLLLKVQFSEIGSFAFAFHFRSMKIHA